jgi:hypothetical protein
MNPHTDRTLRRNRRGRAGAALLLASAVVAIGLSLLGEASAVDRWKRPAGRGNAVGAAQFRPQRFGPNARVTGVPGAGNERRDLAGTGPAGRGPADFQRPGATPVQGGPADPNRQIADLPGRGPAGLQRSGFGAGGPNGFQRGGFQRGALASRFGRGTGQLGRGSPVGRFGRTQVAGRSQPRLRYPGIERRPLIGERGFTGVPPAGETRFVTNEMVFQVAGNMTPQAIDDVARRHGLATVSAQSFALAGGTLVHFRINDGRPVADVIRALEAENIGTAQPNYVFRLQQDQTLAARPGRGDPAQYVVNQLRLTDVHRIALGSNVLVAVIDSEIDAKHPDLAGAVVEEYDAIGNHDKPHLHGTGMAGAIAAHRKLIGIAPGARILAIHAFSSDAADSAQATTEHILMGIDWAIKKGARVINMSFAGPDDPMLQLALQKAHDQGVVLIAAAGNAGPKSPPLYPAADPNVIAVTAVDTNDKLLPQANQGAYIAVAAPGVDVVEPAPNAGYQVTTGTSVAAAHVSGVAALLIEHDPTIDEATVRELLTSSAKDLGTHGRDDQFGWGLVDPYRALMALDLRNKVARDPSRVPPATPASLRAGPVTAR